MKLFRSTVTAFRGRLPEIREIAGWYLVRLGSILLPFTGQALLFQTDGDAFLAFNLAYASQNILAQVLYLGLSVQAYRAGGGFQDRVAPGLASYTSILYITAGCLLLWRAPSDISTVLTGAALAGLVNVHSEFARGQVRIVAATMLNQVIPWTIMIAFVLTGPHQGVGAFTIPLLMYMLPAALSLGFVRANLAAIAFTRTGVGQALRTLFSFGSLFYVATNSLRANLPALIAGTIAFANADLILMSLKFTLSLQNASVYALGRDVRKTAMAVADRSLGRPGAVPAIRATLTKSLFVSVVLSATAGIASYALNAVGAMPDELHRALLYGVLLFLVSGWGLTLPLVCTNAISPMATALTTFFSTMVLCGIFGALLVLASGAVALAAGVAISAVLQRLLILRLLLLRPA